MEPKIDAYWFAKTDALPHGDGRKIVIGEHHSVTGKILICENALHASRDSFDAMRYAPGQYLYKVKCWGDLIDDADKIACRNREYVDMRDATQMLRQFAGWCALSVAHLWDAPPVVIEYLKTGDETLREAAWVAAREATREATREAAAAEAAWAAAWVAAAWVAAWVAAWEAARAARAARANQRGQFASLVDSLFAIRA